MSIKRWITIGFASCLVGILGPVAEAQQTAVEELSSTTTFQRLALMAERVEMRFDSGYETVAEKTATGVSVEVLDPTGLVAVARLSAHDSIFEIRSDDRSATTDLPSAFPASLMWLSRQALGISDDLRQSQMTPEAGNSKRLFWTSNNLAIVGSESDVPRPWGS